MARANRLHHTCPKCGIDTTNIGRHLRRKRCEVQHIRKGPARK